MKCPIIHPPKYGLHKASGQAVVYIRRKAVYLGPYGSKESRHAYERAIQPSWDERQRRAAGPILALRCHGADGRAVVSLQGHDFYLGRCGSPESQERCHRLIHAWLANGRRIEGLERLLQEEPRERAGASPS